MDTWESLKEYARKQAKAGADWAHLRVTVFSAAIVLLGTNSALPTEGEPKYRYVICSRIVDLLYDLTGSTEIDRRQLASHLGGDLQFHDYTLDRRVYDHLQHRAVERGGSGCLDSAPRDLSGFLPGYTERGALRFCCGVGRA